MTSTTVRVSEPTHRTLRELSEQLGESIQGILDQAIEDYRRKRILEQANAGYAALRGNSDAWQEELTERAGWEVTLILGVALILAIWFEFEYEIIWKSIATCFVVLLAGFLHVVAQGMVQGEEKN